MGLKLGGAVVFSMLLSMGSVVGLDARALVGRYAMDKVVGSDVGGMVGTDVGGDVGFLWEQALVPG